MTEFLEVLRAINAVLGLAAVTMVVSMASTHWKVYEARAKWITAAFVTLLLGTVYGSTEQFLLGTPGSPRSIFPTISCVLVVIAWYAADDMFRGEYKPPRHRRSK